jgi:hypothetical protein
MERCRQCGASMGAGHRFCGECGSPVGGCPSCGKPLIPGKRFCYSCGQPLTMAGTPPATPAAPMLRAERELARAWLAALACGQDAAGEALAVAGLRKQSTPYHLAHGLLDHAAWLTAHGDTQGAAVAIGEATSIAVKLGCQPLLDRAAPGRPAVTTAGRSRTAGDPVPRASARGHPGGHADESTVTELGVM